MFVIGTSKDVPLVLAEICLFDSFARRMIFYQEAQVFYELSLAMSRKVLPAQPLDATAPGINISSKGAAHGARETMEAFCRPAGRYVEPLESWAQELAEWAHVGLIPTPIRVQTRDTSSRI